MNLLVAETIMGLLGIMIVFLSLYTQKFLVRQWCALCMSIVCLLIVQFSLAVYYATNNRFQVINYIWHLASFMLLMITILVFFQPIKSLWRKAITANIQRSALNRWEQNTVVFEALLKVQKKVECSASASSLQLGNPDATFQITIVCNPYCYPCAKAHHDINELLEKLEKK